MERRANHTKIPSLSRRRLAKRQQAPVIEEQARANLEPAEHFSNDSGFGGDLLSSDNPEVVLPLYRLIRRPSNESMLTDTEYIPAKRTRRSYNSGSNSPDSSVESPKETCDDSIFHVPVPSTPTEYGSEFEQSNASSIDSSPVQRKGSSKRRRRMHSDSMANYRNMTSELKGNHPSRSRDGRLQLKILKQPEKQHRARYLTEGSRGAVKDMQGEGYPVVKLIGQYDNPITLQVFIANDEGKVAPHMFYQACKICGKNASRCQEVKVDGTAVIEIQMDCATDALSCDCVGILKERNVDVEARFGHLNGNSRKRSTSCRMVFRTTIINSDGSSELLQVVSDPILCTQPPGAPEVQKISLDSCPVVGGKELFIIGKNFAKDSEVVFRELELNAEDYITRWEETVIPDKDFLNQSHLVCQVPPYRDMKVMHSVCIQLMVSCYGKLSDPHEFTYHPVKPASDEQTVVAPTLPKGVALPALEINRHFAETGEVPKSLPLETLQQPFMKNNAATIVVSQPSNELDKGAAVGAYAVQLLKPPVGNDRFFPDTNNKAMEQQQQFNEVPLLLPVQQWPGKELSERAHYLGETKASSIMYTVQQPSTSPEGMLCKAEEVLLQPSPISDPNPISPLPHTSVSRTRKQSSIYSPTSVTEDPEVMVKDGSGSRMLDFSISGQISMPCPDDPEKKEAKFSFNTDTKYNDIRDKTLHQVVTEEIKRSMKSSEQPDSNLENSSDAQSPFTSKDNDEQRENQTKSDIEELRAQLKSLTEVVQSLKSDQPTRRNSVASFPVKVENNSQFLANNYRRNISSEVQAFRTPEILLDTATDALNPPLSMVSGMATSFRDSLVQTTLGSGQLSLVSLGESQKSLNTMLHIPQTTSVRANCHAVSASQQTPILFVSTNATQNVIPTTTMESRFTPAEMSTKAPAMNNINSKALLLKPTSTMPFYTNTVKAALQTSAQQVNEIHHSCPPAIFDKQKIIGNSNSFVGILNREDNQLPNRNIQIVGQQVPSGLSPNEWTAKRKYDWGEVIKHEAPSQQTVMKKAQHGMSANQADYSALQHNNAMLEPIKAPDQFYFDLAGQSIPDNNPKLSREDPLLSSALIVDNPPTTTEGDKLQNLMASDVMYYLNTVCSSGQDDKKAQS